ncbi:DUF2207 domain-containing protein [Enemella sp. A6]|uniref:DUF2207 domain-containing protein n=1 Tax=Enemella sp. A6 TaxID=3440152 RepID=UPI003EBFBDEB
MYRVLRLLALVGLVLGTVLMTPGTAHAANDEIRRLDVRFDVQPDGSMLARFELEWRFAEKGRHGIKFGIVTRESWEPEPDKDVVYEIDQIEVSSPSGAPAMFTQESQGWGSNEEINLQIGDPDTALKTRDATYVISYRVRGAMRTFDGVPELQWDVISDNYPTIKELNVRVSGPDGVTRGRCDTGPMHGACGNEVRDGVAQFHGKNIERATTVYVQFPPGSIDNAEPTLEKRRISSAEVASAKTDVEVSPDGSARVRYTMGYLLPTEDESETLRLQLATRLPWDESRDQTIDISDLSITDGDGNALEWEDTGQRDANSLQERQLSVYVPIDRADPTIDVIVQYKATGAVAVDGDLAAVRVPMLASTSLASADIPRSARFEVPGPVQSARCLRSRYKEVGVEDCFSSSELKTDGNTATGAWDDYHGPTSSAEILSVAFPASSLTGSVPPLAKSLDAEHRRNTRLGLVTNIGGGLALAALGLALGRVQFVRDFRYAQVAPGVVDSRGPVRPARRRDEIPVAFNPPEIPLHIAGLLQDRKFQPSHMAAVLVDLAVKGAVTLRSDPIGVARAEEVEGLTQSEQQIVRWATDKPGRVLPITSARKMRTTLEHDQLNYLKDRAWFQEQRTWVRWLVPALVLGVLLAAGLWFVSTLGTDHDIPPWIGLVIGAGVGFILSAKPAEQGLQARGRAALDQVEGFRTYLATAEAEQLAFEADQDIFRRYLPWAVLFDLTDRWTRVCRELARDSGIDAPDVSFISGATLSSLNNDMRSFASEMRTASAPPSTSSSSSGGSGGGSSGFSSGGGGGGGGGGGTSASSW